MTQQTVYALYGDLIGAEATPSAPLYHLSKSLASLTHKDTSLHISRITTNDAEADISDPKDNPPKRTPLYTLVHPTNAQYRTDIPAPYYMTSTSTLPTLGNIKLDASFAPSLTKKYLLPFHKPTFTAHLHPASTSSSSPLFPKSDTSLQALFTIKPSRAGRICEWLDASGKQVIAREEAPDKKQQLPPRLTIRQDLAPETRDALIALWALRLWWSVAEEKDFEKEVMMELTPPESVFYNGSMNKMGKRMGALGGLVAIGAC
jgi:hypothetical protein